MKKFILIVFYLFVGCTLSYTGEIGDRFKIRYKASELLLKEDYKTLSALAKAYRDTEEKTSGGRWKLRFVYHGIYEAISTVLERDYNIKTWDKYEKELLNWTRQQPNEPAAHISYAFFLINKAWIYRGTSYAKNVSKENWILFHTEVNKAIKYLNEHKDVASQDPHWYAVILNLAKLDSWSRLKFYDMVNEAINRYPNYDGIYEFTLYYMDPKWNGYSKKEIEDIAQKIISATKNKDGAYARFYWMAKDILEQKGSHPDFDINWKTMRDSMEKLSKKYPSQHNYNGFAYLSCKYNQKKTMQKYMDQIEGYPILDIWETQENFESCKDNQEINITTISPDKVIDYIANHKSKKPLLVYFSSYRDNDVLKDINKIGRLVEEYKGQVDLLSVNFYPKKLSDYPDLITKFSLEYYRLPVPMIFHKKKKIHAINESAIPEATMKMLKSDIDSILKKKAHDSQKKIHKGSARSDSDPNGFPTGTIAKIIAADKILNYIDKNNNDLKPLVIYFNYFNARLPIQKPSEGIEFIAEKHKNEYDIVTVYFDMLKKDSVHKAIKKRFNMNSYPSTVIIHKNKVLYNKGGNLDNKSTRKTMDKKLFKYMEDQSINLYDK